MHPQPLIGILPHISFEHFVEQRGIRYRVGFVVAGMD